MKDKKVITIISGGPKPESKISRLCANDIKPALNKNNYDVHEIIIDGQGQWKQGHYTKEPRKALAETDLVINALFGKFGESGRVQNTLDRLGYIHTSSKGPACALAADKLASRHIFEQARFNVPQTFGIEYSKILNIQELQRDIKSRFSVPFVIKPNSHTSSMGVSVVKEAGDIHAAILSALKFDKTILVEEYLRGVEVICGVVETKSGLVGLPPLMVATYEHILNVESEFDSLLAKRVLRATFDENLLTQIKALSVFAHRLLGLRHYSRVDCIIVRDKIYILNVHSLPGLSRHSLMVRAIAEWGLEFESFLEHLIDLALSEKNATFEKAYNRVNIA